MEDGSELAGNGDLRLLEAAALGDAQSPAPERREPIDPGQKRIRRFVEAAPKKSSPRREIRPTFIVSPEA